MRVTFKNDPDRPNSATFMRNLNLVYPMPCRGSQRAFNLDISEMDLSALEADIYRARQRLLLETEILNRMYLKERLYLLAVRASELKRAIA